MSTYLGKSPIFVAGGSNGLGLEIVKQLSSLGTPVKALVRRAESKDMLEKLPGVQCTIGDALVDSDVQQTMTGCVAAITTLGGKSDDGSQSADYNGNSNVVEQAGILGVERIIMVTSIGCGKTKDALSESTYNVLKDALVAKDKAERDLRMYTNLDWTIIRPGGLKSDPPTGKALLTEDETALGVIHRADVAALVVQVLGSQGKCTRKELSAVDPSLSSDYNSQTLSKLVPFEV